MIRSATGSPNRSWGHPRPHTSHCCEVRFLIASALLLGRSLPCWQAEVVHVSIAPEGSVTRVILVASSILLALLGIACLFVPDALSSLLFLPNGASAALPLAAAPLIGIAGLNWVGRGAIYGGIYGRPIVLANFLTAGIGTLVLLRGQAGTWPLLGSLLISLFALYWLGFGLLLFRGPFRQTSSTAQ